MEFFLISFSDCSLQLRRNTTDFYVLILYASIFPNSCISSSSFLLDYLGFFNIEEHVICEYSFTSSFQI